MKNILKLLYRKRIYSNSDFLLFSWPPNMSVYFIVFFILGMIMGLFLKYTCGISRVFLSFLMTVSFFTPLESCLAIEAKTWRSADSAWKNSDALWKKNDLSEKAEWRIVNNDFLSSDKKWAEIDKNALANWRGQEKKFKSNDEKWKTEDSK